MCGVNRLAGEVGACGAAAELRIGRAALHSWDEPVISGQNGSGTVFFSHCNLDCVFCQNQMISHGGQGRSTSVPELAGHFLRLQAEGAHNVNLVTAGHYLPHVAAALRLAKKQGLTLPVVYNCGGYERMESLRRLDGLVDVYLPDLKYVSPYWSGLYSGAADYFDYASTAVDEMLRQVGGLEVSGGLMRRGVIVRHLMLPGLLGDTKAVLRYIAAHWRERVYVSLMRQYTPVAKLPRFPDLNRTVTDEEYAEAVAELADLGISMGFLQDGEAIGESFIPEFWG